MINLLNKFDLSNRKNFLIILLAFLIIYLDFRFLIKLQFQGIKSQSSKVIKLKKDINTLTQDLATMQNLEKEQIKIKAGAKQLKKIIFEGQQSALLEEISSIANRNNIKIIKILPLKESKSKDGMGSLDMSKFLPFLITLDLTGDYHHLGKFINDLENAKIFIDLEGIKISPDSNSYLQQKINLVLKTYVKK